jgi:predicted DCC family thiol-disulfide oxidoreductase YuxK
MTPHWGAIRLCDEAQVDRNVPFMPTLIYDADCGFCTTSATHLASRGTFGLQAWQFIDDLPSLGLDLSKVTEAAHWVEGGRVVASGSDAIAAALKSRGGLARLLGAVLANAPAKYPARLGYALIAKNRHRMPGGTAACRVPSVTR